VDTHKEVAIKNKRAWVRDAKLKANARSSGRVTKRKKSRARDARVPQSFVRERRRRRRNSVQCKIQHVVLKIFAKNRE
jgi:hypothetical protein